MPEYFLPEMGVPCARSTYKHSRKIYRNCKGFSGPNLICKYPFFFDTHDSVYGFMDSDGTLLNSSGINYNEQLPLRDYAIPFPSLKIASHIALERFGVPYSLNKCQRWKIYDELRRVLHNLQDEDIGLRVSLLRLNVDCFQNWNYLPYERQYLNEYGNDVILEFHGYNGQKKIDIFGGHMKMIDLLRKPLRSAKKKNLHVWLRMRKPQQSDVPHHKKLLHLFITEQLISYHPGLINSCGKKLGTKLHNQSYARENHRKNCLRCPNRHSKWKLWYKLFVNDVYFKYEEKNGMKQLQRIKSKQSTSPVDEFSCFCDVADVESEVDFYNDRIRNAVPLKEFLVVRIDRKIRCKRRKRCRETWQENWITEYEKWYHGTSDTFTFSLKNVSEPSHTTTDIQWDYAELCEFITPVGDENNGSFVNILECARKIDGIYPKIFRCDFPFTEDFLSTYSVPKCLVNFVGVTIFHPNPKNKLMRIILNPEENTVKKGQKMYNLPRRQKNSIHIGPSQLNSADRTLSQEDIPLHCCVCDTFDEFSFALQCGHFTCRGCWIQHAMHSLQNFNVPIRCPGFACRAMLTDEQLLILLPLSTCQRYRMLLSNIEFMRPQWLHCKNCPRILYTLSSSLTKHITRCSCGEYLCLECKDELHCPLTCAEAESYRNFCVSMNVDNNGMNIRLKRCPNCHIFCERNGGCNLMTCLCGTQFCYVCNEEMSESYHYQCDDYFVEVELVDVPSKIYQGLPTKVFGDCRKYRNGQTTVRRYLRDRLNRIFGNRNVQNEQIIELFIMSYQFLELSLFKRELLLRSAKRLPKYNSTLWMKAGILRRRVSSIQFYLARLKDLLDCTIPNIQKIVQLKQKLENTLCLCFSDTC